MDDRELLELAAKAAGYELAHTGESEKVLWLIKPGSIPDFNGERSIFPWNPLTDDGDALRLAVKLDIHIKRFSGSTSAEEWTTSNRVEEHDHWSVNGGDPMAATRRAIVRAAAEIGRCMP